MLARGSVRVRHGQWWGRIYKAVERGKRCRELTVCFGLESELSKEQAREKLAAVLAANPHLVSRRRAVARWVRPQSDSDVPAVPGCYVLADGKHTLYVGQSVDVRSRLAQHGWQIRTDGVETEWGYFRGAYVKYRSGRCAGEWLMLEYRLIRRLSPALNRRHQMPGSRLTGATWRVDLGRAKAV